MKLSLKKRLSRMGCAEASGGLAGETISCFFQGVGLITGKKYPEWLLQRLLETYKAPAHYPYGKVVLHAYRQIQAAELDAMEQDGYDLMYQLLIEPFFLMNENEQEV